MTRITNLSVRALVAGGVSAAALIWSGDITTTSLLSTAEARIGRPATPMSVAGVARRTTRRAVAIGTTGVGVAPVAGVGVVARGVGVRAAPGVRGLANRGGPVNRVGRR